MTRFSRKAISPRWIRPQVRWATSASAFVCFRLRTQSTKWARFASEFWRMSLPLRRGPFSAFFTQKHLKETVSPKGEKPPTQIRFTEHLIMDGYTYPFGIAGADLDGDGDLDLTSADAEPHDKLYWFENRGTPGDGKLWPRHIITQGKLPGAYDVELVDLDGDGDLDAAGSGWRPGNQFSWFENDGTPAEGEWTKRAIEIDVGETRTIRAGDFDGDGDLDVVMALEPGGPCTRETR